MSTNARRRALPNVVGEQIRRIRRDFGITQDDVAAAAKGLGLSWGRSSVAHIEAGTQELGMTEFTLLPLVLTHALRATGHSADVRFADLLPDDARIQWCAEFDIDGAGLRHVLADRPEGAQVEMSERRVRRVADALADALGGQAPREADLKVARALGVPASEVSRLSHRLWGRDLTSERDARLGDVDGTARQKQARRGHITRALIAEMSAAIEGEQ